MALEEILVTDALTIWPIPDENRLRMVDGTTIRPTTDYFGEIPAKPTPAYIQVLYGYPRWWSDRSHMYYLPMRTTVYSPYGTSPIEFIIQATVAMIKKDSSLVSNFTQGNVPAAFAGLPSSWSPDQIQKFTEWYNAIIEGNVARPYKLMFLPHDSGGVPVTMMNQANINETKLDEWLMTLACWAYGNDRSEFGIVQNAGIGGSGLMQGGENNQVRGMTQVYTRFLSQFIDLYNREILKAPFAKSHWIGLEPPEDELTKAQVHQIYVGLVYSAEYVADELGIPEKYRIKQPMASGLPSTPEGFVATPKLLANPNVQPMVSPLQSTEQALKYQSRALIADLKLWDEKATRFAKKGWEQVEFTDTILPEAMVKSIHAQVLEAKIPEAVHKVFTEAMAKVHEDVEALSKFSHPALDPNQPVKDVAATELETVMREYFEGLKQRITTKVIQLKES